VRVSDDNPRDEGEGNSHERVPDHGDKEEGPGYNTKLSEDEKGWNSGGGDKLCCGYFFVKKVQAQRMMYREANPDIPKMESIRALRMLRNVFQKISNEESPLLLIPRRGGSCEATIWIAVPVTNPPTAGAGMNSTNQPSLSTPRRKITTPWKRGSLSGTRKEDNFVTHT